MKQSRRSRRHAFPPSPSPVSPGTALVLLIAAAMAMTAAGCRSIPEPEAPAAPESAPEPEPVPEPDPFVTDWAGTTWIYRDVPEGSREFPGYRGFHLARDGRLLLINMDHMTGDTWTAEGNRLEFTLLVSNSAPAGTPSPAIPVEGSLLAFRPEDSPEGDMPLRMRLISEADAAGGGTAAKPASGIVLEKAGVNIDIVENHWIPRELRDGDSVMWPMNREIHLILLPDGLGGLTYLGFGGVNRFRGNMDLGTELFLPGPTAITRKIGPASPFENLYVRRIGETDRFVQVDDDLFLFSGTLPTVSFRVRLFD